MQNTLPFICKICWLIEERNINIEIMLQPSYSVVYPSTLTRAMSAWSRLSFT